jgi:hypothetical protein
VAVLEWADTCKSRDSVLSNGRKHGILKVTKSEALNDRKTDKGFFPSSSLATEILVLSRLQGSVHAPQLFGVGSLTPPLQGTEPQVIVMEFVGKMTVLDFLIYEKKSFNMSSNTKQPDEYISVFQWIAGQIFDVIDEEALYGIVHSDLHFDNLMISWGDNMWTQPRMDTVRAVHEFVRNGNKDKKNSPTVKAIDFNRVEFLANNKRPILLAIGRAAVRLDAYGRYNEKLSIGPNEDNKARLSKIAKMYKTEKDINTASFVDEINKGLSPGEAARDYKTLPENAWLGALLNHK